MHNTHLVRTPQFYHLLPSITLKKIILEASFMLLSIDLNRGILLKLCSQALRDKGLSDWWVHSYLISLGLCSVIYARISVPFPWLWNSCLQECSGQSWDKIAWETTFGTSGFGQSKDLTLENFSVLVSLLCNFNFSSQTSKLKNYFLFGPTS